MEDGHTLFDYDVNLNDLIQLMIRVDKPQLEDVLKPSTSNGPEITSVNGTTSDEDDRNVRFMRLVDTSNVPCDILLLMDVNK